MGRFCRNGRINPAEVPPNFAVRDVSDETAESIPANFALGTIPAKRPNFRRISHSGTFPPKWPNQSRRSLHSRRFHRNGRINLAELPPNFALGDISDETTELPPNFALRDVSNKMAEFCTRGRFPRNGRISAQFRTRGRFPRNGRIFVEFCTRGRF
ncbi:MAG: hypothetical protein Q8881_02420 [Sweet potato little leaf phytoplasma]|nr:hypothetical protein [Sweet potato little leaf phytoplasma]